MPKLLKKMLLQLHLNKIILFFSLFLLSSCGSTVEKLSRVGKAPNFAKIEIPAIEENVVEEKRRYTQTEVSEKYAQRVNSLWSPGSNNFFRNKHNWKVGDIVVVKVNITDSAKIDNSTQHSRKGSDKVGIPNILGVENKIAQVLSNTGDPANLINSTNQHQHQGTGNISRKEDIRAGIAAVITQILSNGNLIIQGKQEVRINSELREVTVAGIIRSKDITDENTIASEQMAEARISYGGRGVVSDAQEPRVGNQVLDILSPF